MPLSATNLIYNYIYGQPHIQAPSDEGAVERSETEGEKAIKIKFSLSLPQSFFCEKRQLLPSCGIPILFMRLGAPHKIDRCANRCSLYPPQAAVAYVARQREPVSDNRKGCPYGCANILISYYQKNVINQRQFNGGSKPPPYRVGYQIQFVLLLHRGGSENSNTVLYNLTLVATCSHHN